MNNFHFELPNFIEIKVCKKEKQIVKRTWITVDELVF